MLRNDPRTTLGVWGGRSRGSTRAGCHCRGISPRPRRNPPAAYRPSTTSLSSGTGAMPCTSIDCRTSCPRPDGRRWPPTRQSTADASPSTGRRRSPDASSLHCRYPTASIAGASAYPEAGRYRPIRNHPIGQLPLAGAAPLPAAGAARPPRAAAPPPALPSSLPVGAPAPRCSPAAGPGRRTEELLRLMRGREERGAWRGSEKGRMPRKD